MQVTVDADALDDRLGYPQHDGADERLGWLINFNPVRVVARCIAYADHMQQVTIKDKDSNRTLSAVNCYFICQDGSMFRAAYPYAPYFYVQVRGGLELEVDAYLRRKFEGMLRETNADVFMEDLDLVWTCLSIALL